MSMNEIIRQKRKELELTQEQLAAYLGVSAPAVHKWEKGTSFPDVTLLPALARILKIDLNTLFSYEKEMSEKEIGLFLNQTYEMLEKEGFEAAYQSAMDKVREFPTCGVLLNSVASFLDGMVMLYAREKQERYMDEIEELYERAVIYSDGETKDRANYMLIGRCLRRREYDRAEEIWEKLPDQKIDKESLKASICMSREKYGEAAVVLETQLWKQVNVLQTTMMNLMDCYEKLGELEKAVLCAENIKTVVDRFDLIEYTKFMVELQQAVKKKDKAETLLYLDKMLTSMREPYILQDRPLFSRIPKKTEQTEGDRSGVWKQMASTIVSGIRQDNGLDGQGFLKDDTDLMSLLERHGN